MSDFDIVGPEVIRDGVATDAYFEWTEATLRHAGKNPRAVAEVTADQFPGGDFELFAGVKGTAELLVGRDIDVDAMPEGTLFGGGPVMRTEGDYLEFARLKTSLPGFPLYVSGRAAAAPETRSATSDSTVLSSDTRHVHPVIIATAERSALIAGLDGFSYVTAGETLGKEALGTMPHTLLITFGRSNQAEAFRAFDEAVDESVPRAALCDTYGDETEEMLQTVETLDDDPDSVRPDTTSSCRDDFRRIVRETRWELDARSHEDMGIFVSGGPGPVELRHLRDVVEDFGVGGRTPSADSMDFVLNIVKVSGGPAAKRGKLLDVREAYRMADGDHHIGLHGQPDPTSGGSLLEPLIRDGEVVSRSDFDIDAAATWVSEDAELVGLGGVNKE